MNPNVLKQALSLLQNVPTNLAKGYTESPAQFGQNTNAGMAETAGNYLSNGPGGEIGAIGGALAHIISPTLSHLPLAVGIANLSARNEPIVNDTNKIQLYHGTDKVVYRNDLDYGAFLTASQDDGCKVAYLPFSSHRKIK